MFKKTDYEILDEYINNENDIKKKDNLILLQNKIHGVYIGSNKEKAELYLKDETLKKYNILTRAIKENRRVKIEYYSYNDGMNTRIIEPAEMFLYKDGWFCAANCLLRGDIRHFELKRISKIELLDELF